MNKPNKTELEYFIRYSLDSDKYKRYIELYDEIERLNNIINDIRKDIEVIEQIDSIDTIKMNLRTIIYKIKGEDKNE